MGSLIGDFLKWLSVFLAAVMVFCLFGELKGFGLLLGAVVIYCILLRVYAYLQTRQEYLRDPEASQLIGRMTCGIDNKGRETRRIIWYK
jgi:Na+/H+ antiporter NhaD/arsenite permease-like protein